MSLTLIKKHSTTNDLIEGQLVFAVADSSAPTVPIYLISTLKTSAGVIAIVFDVREAFNAGKVYKGATKSYLTNLGCPAEFIAAVVDAPEGSYVATGSGQVTIAKASLTSIGDSTITTDQLIATVAGTAGTAPDVSDPTTPAVAGPKPAVVDPAKDPVTGNKTGLAAIPVWGWVLIVPVAVVVVVVIAKKLFGGKPKAVVSK